MFLKVAKKNRLEEKSNRVFLFHCLGEHEDVSGLRYSDFVRHARRRIIRNV